jgi:hypothetical protein
MPGMIRSGCGSDAAGGRARRAAGVCLGLLLAGCAPQPLLDGTAEIPPLVLVPTVYAGVNDGRARFREIFCALDEDHGAELPDHRPCELALHRLSGEGPASGRRVNLGRSRLDLRLVLVPGLAEQCLGELALPLSFAARHVERLGYEVGWIDVDGLSSSTRNAGEIRDAILAMPESAERPIVLVGYSKGASDMLEAAVDPAVAARVAAIVSLGGAINGSPLADRASEVPVDLVASLPGIACATGDRGALDSLRRATRTGWLAARHPLPPLRSYSLVSYTTREQVSAPLRSYYDDLSEIEPRNDGQLLFYDQILPGSTLLGYLNGDHWAIAVPIAREAPLAATIVDQNAFPREILLEALLKQIEEDLLDAADGAPPARP